MSKPSGQSTAGDEILNLFSPPDKRIIQEHPPTLRAVQHLCMFSPALGRSVACHPELARWLFWQRAFEFPAGESEMAADLSSRLASADGLDAVMSALRYVRLRELSRLTIRDLSGLADLDEVMATLSSLADVCLREALAVASRQTADKFGLEPDNLGFSPVILGMGKLGARELNFSSDIDLIYLYRPTHNSSSHTAATQHLFALASRLLSELTQDGHVFRVDLNLRPGGKDGALAQSIEAAMRHYLIHGAPWERMALLKARPVAGDEALGRRFLSDVSPFVFRRHLDYTSLEELKDLKERFNRENRTRMRKFGRLRGPAAINVKLSPGGIREIEFFAQALILTFGGRLVHLRRPTTLGALSALAEEQIISDEDARVLSEAYRFLRTVEHRLQQKELTQTQMLPKDLDARDRLALSMGFDQLPWPDFLECLNRHMAEVSRRYNSLLSEPSQEQTRPQDRSGPQEELRIPEWAHALLAHDDESAGVAILADAGFSRPDAAWAACRNIRQQRFLPGSLSRYARHLERILPAMIAETAATPDPDRAILHLERFIAAVGPKAGFFLMLEENPRLIHLLSVLFSASDYLADILIMHPALLDSLVDRRSARLVKSRDEMAAELGAMIRHETEPEDALTVMRRFKNDETLRIGLYDLMSQIGFDQIQEQLTSLAEVVLEYTMRLVQRVVYKIQDPPSVPLAVMGLGKLGGRELSYGSDLDLIFILGQEENASSLTMMEAIRLAQRFISYLSIPLEAGPGYEIDSRLRPSGSSGPLVVTTSSFAKYHETSMLWERQALLKMRWVWGPEAIGREVKELSRAAIFGRDLPEDASAQIHHLRQRMIRERARLKPGFINFKFSPGGLVDVEFITQYLQLVHGRSHEGAVRSASTAEALRAMIDLRLGPTDLASLEPAYDLLGRTASRLNLVYARSGDRAAFTPDEIRKAPLPFGEEAMEMIESAMSNVVEIYNRVFETDFQADDSRDDE